MTIPTESEMHAAGWKRTPVGNWWRDGDVALRSASGGWFAWPASKLGSTHDTLADAVAACDRARDTQTAPGGARGKP
jgi:hypothetical protein